MSYEKEEQEWRLNLQALLGVQSDREVYEAVCRLVVVARLYADAAVDREHTRLVIQTAIRYLIVNLGIDGPAKP
jgi:hypothetical protein